jgi:hypothetical protein
LFVVSKLTKRKKRTNFLALKVFEATPHVFCLKNIQVRVGAASAWGRQKLSPAQSAVINGSQRLAALPLTVVANCAVFTECPGDFQLARTSQSTRFGEDRHNYLSHQMFNRDFLRSTRLSIFPNDAYYLQVLFCWDQQSSSRCPKQARGGVDVPSPEKHR